MSSDFCLSTMIEDSRLKVFMAVVEKRSFTLAAKKIGVSQPSVSQTIAELEKATGVRLFDRTRSAVTLTSEGETFKLFAARIIQNYEDLNLIFNDYEAFKTVSDKLSELTREPTFYLFKDILSR